MGLVLSTPPEGSVSALRAALGTLATRGQLDERRLRRTPLEDINVTAPHPVYVLGLSDLVEPDLKRARPTGWRYLVEADGDVVAAAETAQRDEQTHAFTQLNHGPFVNGTVTALSEAERLAAERDFELRILSVPALYVHALWLQPVGTEGEAATLIPLAPAPPGIDANRAYPEAELLTVLAARAREVPVMSPDDTRGG